MIYEIEKYLPCNEAVKFRSNYKSFADAWEACPRGDWMLWIVQRAGVNLKILTKAKALCALTVENKMRDKRSIYACEVALKYSEGKATRKQLDAAAAAAADAAYTAAYAAAAADAAYAAADADADAAYAAADAAYAAYTAAYAAADADAAYAAAAYTQKENQKQTADICREILTEQVFKKLKIK